MLLTPRDVEIRHFHLFCGLGGGARGFNRGQARIGHAQATFRCLGGVDVDAASIRDFERLAHARGTMLDLFSREQYAAFHGHEAPADWRESTPDDLRRAAGNERPHIVFTSPPCKGYSGLLSETKSRSAKYAALNALAERGVWLALEAWADDPPEFFLLENVPRIQNRGRDGLDRIIRLLEHYRFAVAETTHDCGELGWLAQSRKRFLLVARHRDKVPPFLYEPPKRPLRAVGDVIGKLPVPGPDLVLPMHRLPALQWQTWVRLAFVEAGSDWRSLNRLHVAAGVLRDFRLQVAGDWNGGVLGVRRWSSPSATVTGRGAPTCGAFAVADPRTAYTGDYQQIGVRRWTEPTGAVSGQSQVGGGPHSVADPRYGSFGEHAGKMRVEAWGDPAHVITGSDRVGSGALSIADPRLTGAPRFNHVYRIVPWQEPSPTVAGGGGPAGGLAVADPRTGFGAGTHNNVLHVTAYDAAAKTITSGDHPSGGALCVADPRPAALRDGKTQYRTTGEYGVVPWDGQAGAVTSQGQHDNGRWSVADPRSHAGTPAGELPAATDRLVAVIRALDGTYHRPFTTLELAALQSLVDPDELLELDGLSDSAWRERIGNAVPSDAAEAIANVMAETLLLAWSGETFALSAAPIWVQPLVVAVTVDPRSEA